MKLDLMLEENESEISRAEHISQRLLQHTYVLVVLDNLWERVELERLGIPLGNNKRLRLGGWNWVAALVQLRKWIHAGGMASITSSIRSRLDCLPYKYVQYVFLFCCLFPEDLEIEIEVLLLCLLGEQQFGYDCYSLEPARLVLDDTIGMLVSSPLLLYDKEDHQHVWMNDVVRDAAIDIASQRYYNFIVKDGMALIACTDTEFVMGTKIRCNLPNQIIAPNLFTLSLNGYNDLNEIPPDFFTERPARVGFK